MGDVYSQVKDGNLGRSTVDSGTGIQVKVGVSSVASSTPIQITSTMDSDTIKSKLGDCPLADACICSIEW